LILKYHSKMKLDELKSGQTTQRESIQEIETGLSRVKLANQLGCETQELTTIPVECPKAKLGMIIGKQGANIQKLMEKYKVTIDVDKGTCIATLTGGAAAVEAAKAEIESISQSIETEITLPAETITYLTGQHSQELGTLKSKYEDIYC
jgi:polyribonucleotide nucleotidyltransferase